MNTTPSKSEALLTLLTVLILILWVGSVTVITVLGFPP